MQTRIVIQRDPGCLGGGGCLGVVFLAAWITAVVRDAMMVKWVWLIVDMALAPIGVIRGILMWFGLA